MTHEYFKFQNHQLVPYYDEHDVMVQVRPIAVDESGEMKRVQGESRDKKEDKGRLRQGQGHEEELGRERK